MLVEKYYQQNVFTNNTFLEYMYEEDLVYMP